METFKEISIGGISKDHLIQKLTSAGVQFNEYAKTLFEHATFAPSDKIEKVALVKIKPSDLGLSNPYSLEEVIAKATLQGLKPCPLYLAAFLRLDYMDQPEGAYLTVASTRVENNENYPTGYYIRNTDNILWLRGYRAIGVTDHPITNEFIFIHYPQD